MDHKHKSMIVKKIFLICIFLSVVSFAFAQLSDNEVINLAQEAQKQGLNQQQIGLMLMQKGATKDQLERLAKTYQSAGKSTGTQGVGENSISGRKYTDQTQSEENSGEKQKQDDKIKQEDRIFGHDIFTNKKLSFEPQLNIPTPDTYVFGPGDQILIDVWGASEIHIKQYISPEGNINIEGIGPVSLNGLTVKEAENRIKRSLNQIYSGISNSSTFIKLSLGEIRSIKVNVMGEVDVPGTYTLPSLATVFHALYSAGGVNQIGSMRSVKVYRSGTLVSDIDVYDYILNGKSKSNINLRDGDVIVVSPYQNLVKIKGKVKRPMMYEMKNTESLADLISYSGGFKGDAFKREVRLIRKTGREYKVFNVDDSQYSSFDMNDGDEIAVDSVLQRFQNMVKIEGAVYRPGIYAIDDEVMTLVQLINRAEGIRGDAFLNRAVLTREKEDYTQESMPINIPALLSGEIQDIPLHRNDVLYIPAITDLREEYAITINGAVGKPGIYPFLENMSLEDLIVRAGGLLESASTIRIDVARRIKDPQSTVITDTKSRTYTLSINNGLKITSDPTFRLQPFDVVYVRESPTYQKQMNVSVRGEIFYEGEYVIAERNERISDLIKRAGGLTNSAFVDGATLNRKMTDDDKVRVKSMLELVKHRNNNVKDSLSVEKLNIEDSYLVGIDLRKAIENPGSNFDVVLKPGDELIIPEYNGTVRVTGAVMYPNTVVYRDGLKWKDYINLAGGTAENAKQSKAFIVYMNGSVSKATKGKIMPGCEIIVPDKRARRSLGLPEILSMGTSTAALAAMVTSIINTTK